MARSASLLYRVTAERSLLALADCRSDEIAYFGDDRLREICLRQQFAERRQIEESGKSLPVCWQDPAAPLISSREVGLARRVRLRLVSKEGPDVDEGRAGDRVL